MVLCFISLNSWVSALISRTSHLKNKILFTSMTKKTTFKWPMGLPSWFKISMQELFFLLRTFSYPFPAPKWVTAPLVVDMHFTGVSERSGTSYLIISLSFQSSLFFPWSPELSPTLHSSTSFHPNQSGHLCYYTFPQYLEDSYLFSVPQLHCRGAFPHWGSEEWAEM